MIRGPVPDSDSFGEVQVRWDARPNVQDGRAIAHPPVNETSPDAAIAAQSTQESILPSLWLHSGLERTMNLDTVMSRLDLATDHMKVLLE